MYAGTLPLHLSSALERCHALDLSLLPVAAGSKRAAGPWQSYQTRRASLPQVREWGRGYPAYGIVCGSLSGVVVVDTDTPEAEEWAAAHLPPTPWQVATAKGVHRYYSHPGTPIPNTKPIPGVDIRGDGGYVLGPWSAHPSGGRYEPTSWPWDPGQRADLPTYDPSWWPTRETTHTPDRPSTAREMAERWLAKRDRPAQGERNHAVYSTACAMYDFGLDRGEVENLILPWVRSFDEPLGEKETLQTVASAEKSRQAPRYPKGTRVGSGPPEEPRREQSGREDPRGWSAEEWPVPQPLSPWTAPDPIQGVFPPLLEAYCASVSEHNQTPPDNAHAIALGALAAAVQGQYRIRIDGRIENLALAATVGANSAERKSADFGELLQPLRAYEELARERWAQARTEHEAEKEILQKRKEHIIKRAATKGEDLRTELTEVIERLRYLDSIRPRKLTCQDITPERLQALLAEQGSIALMSAEGGPLEAMAGKYSGRRELANIYLQGFSGETVSLERQSRQGELAIDPSLTMLIMSQPAHLRGIFGDGVFQGRGLLERFFYVLPAPRAGYRKVSDVPPICPALRGRYQEALGRLLPPPDPLVGTRPERQTLEVTPEGSRAIQELAAWLEPQYRPDGALYHVAAWAGRLPTLAAKVGALWHLWEAAERAQAVPLLVSPDCIRRAVRWVWEYVLPMGLCAWGILRSDLPPDHAREVLAVLLSSDRPLSTREVLRRKRSLRAEQVAEAIQILEAHDLIRRARNSTNSRGRPSEVLIPNPQIRIPENPGQKGQKSDLGPKNAFLSFLSHRSEESTFTFEPDPEEAKSEKSILLEDLFGEDPSWD